MKGFLSLFCSPLLLLAACAADGPLYGTARPVVVLSADQATEIVVPAGFGAATTTLSSVATSEAVGSNAVENEGDESVVDGFLETSAEIPATTTNTDAQETSTSVVDRMATDTTAATTTTTTATTTTTVTPTKETVPLAEEEINPGVKLMGALDDFNRCLDGEGHEWIGFPNADLGDVPVNQPSYLAALQLCNSRTQISKAYQEFQTSRSDMSPDEIEQENRDLIDLVDCLRGRGWDVGELRPDETGLLNPGDQFSGPDGDVVTDDIRDCASEIALTREGS
ncbi:MAG TPA: hypothetical protein DGF10_02125 [Acidimicrobiaceae bacterium]|nr:hypothetical protein [Acidimicrobiaceae bacterium]